MKKTTALRTIGVATALGLALAGCSAQPEPSTDPNGAPVELTDVTVRLDWLFQGPNAGFVVADDLGYYEEVGIKVEINPGQGGATTVQLIGNGSEDFGYADAYVAAQYVAQGVPVKVVSTIIRNNPVAVVALKESGIKGPEDLVGASVGFPTGSVAAQQWPSFLEGCDVNESDVPTVAVQAQNLVQSILAGSIQAGAGFAYGLVPVLEANGQSDVVTIPFPECGMNQLSNGIVVNDALIASDPDLVKRFVEATTRGFLYMFEHPEEAAEMVKLRAPEVDVAVTVREIEQAALLITRDDSAGEALGWMSPEAQKQTIENAIKLGGADASLKADAVFTNDFVPSGSEYEAR